MSVRHCALLVLCLACSAGCTAPVAFGRTGETLPAGGARFSVAVPVGLGVTDARITRERHDGTLDTRSYTHTFPPGRYVPAWSALANRILSPFLSVELAAALGLADGFELGVLGGLTRIGTELRLGVLGRSDDPIAIALSAGIAKQLLLEPHGVEYRAGVDMSLRTGLVRPLVNFYLGYTPSALYFVLPGLEGEARDPNSARDKARYTRDELRLSTPVGVAFWVQPGTRVAFNAALVAVPEFVLASYDERDQSYKYSDRISVAAIDDRWSVFIGIRIELVLKPRPKP